MTWSFDSIFGTPGKNGESRPCSTDWNPLNVGKQTRSDPQEKVSSTHATYPCRSPPGQAAGSLRRSFSPLPATPTESQLAVSGDQVRDLLTQPEMTLEIRPVHDRERARAAWRHTFGPHHYMEGGLAMNAHFFVCRLRGPAAPGAAAAEAGSDRASDTSLGPAVGFVSACMMPGGSEARSRATYRENRLVVLPQYQGFGLGPKLSEAVAQLHLDAGKLYFSVTAHPRLGAHRQREATKPGGVGLWAACANNMTWKHTNLATNLSARRNTKRDPDAPPGRPGRPRKINTVTSAGGATSSSSIGSSSIFSAPPLGDGDVEMAFGAGADPTEDAGHGAGDASAGMINDSAPAALLPKRTRGRPRKGTEHLYAPVAPKPEQRKPGRPRTRSLAAEPGKVKPRFTFNHKYVGADRAAYASVCARVDAEEARAKEARGKPRSEAVAMSPRQVGVRGAADPVVIQPSQGDSALAAEPDHFAEGLDHESDEVLMLCDMFGVDVGMAEILLLEADGDLSRAIQIHFDGLTARDVVASAAEGAGEGASSGTAISSTVNSSTASSSTANSSIVNSSTANSSIANSSIANGSTASSSSSTANNSSSSAGAFLPNTSQPDSLAAGLRSLDLGSESALGSGACVDQLLTLFAPRLTRGRALALSSSFGADVCACADVWLAELEETASQRVASVRSSQSLAGSQPQLSQMSQLSQPRLLESQDSVIEIPDTSDEEEGEKPRAAFGGAFGGAPGNKRALSQGDSQEDGATNALPTPMSAFKRAKTE